MSHRKFGHAIHRHFDVLKNFIILHHTQGERPPGEREQLDAAIIIFKDLIMLTVERLDAALAANAAKDSENADLKTQVTTLQGQVAAAPSADVMAKADQLVTALAGPAPAAS